MPSSHATLPPSASMRWLACPPSVRLNEKFIERFGEETSKYAEEGTLAHSLAELKLRLFTGELDKESYKSSVSELGAIPPEMEKATDYYVDLCEERYYEAKKSCPDALILIEQRLDISAWAPECFGTGDCIIVSDSILNVIDLKYGMGVPVSAIDNPQARCYGLGALHEYGDLFGFEEIRNTIVQPRLDSVSDETLTREELLIWGDTIREPARLAYNGEGEFKSGPHCKFCAAKAVCSERIIDSLRIVELGFASPDIIDDSKIAGIYKALPLIKEWIGAFEEYVKKQALNGQKIEGFKLVRGKRPARAFKDEHAVEEFLRKTSIEPEKYLSEPTLKSVSAIEKSIGKKQFKELLEEYVVQGEGALTLVPEDDPREEYVDAAFNDIM